jgi:hypothetical protein
MSANGKGAKHVVDWTIRQTKNGGFDAAVAVFDTDTDWNQAVESKGRKCKITMILMEPRLEDVLPRVIGISPSGNTKKQLAHYVSKSTDSASYSSYFPLDVLERAAASEKAIADLIDCFRGGGTKTVKSA